MVYCKQMGGMSVYPRKQHKTDRERFLDAFQKQVGTTPEIYLRRKLSGGMQPGELKRLYDLLAVEIAKKAHCTPIRFDEVVGGETPVRTAERHRQRAAENLVPECPRCGAQMVLRTGQSGVRRGQKFWGCSNYPACRYTKNMDDGNKR